MSDQPQDKSVERRHAVERIRAEAMAMRQSDDLIKILGKMWQEMVALGIDITRLNIRFVEGEGDNIRIGRSYYTIPNPKRHGIAWTSADLVEFNDEMTVGFITQPGPRDQKIVDAWRRGEVLSAPVTGAEIAARMDGMNESWGLERSVPLDEKEKANGFHIYVPFQYGIVGFRVDEMKDVYLTITRELTEALSLGYIRYLDFQRLEEQNRALEENLRLLRETQQQLVMQEKMASLGGLVAGVAHEINTPVGIGLTATTALEQQAQKLSRDFESNAMKKSQLQEFLKSVVDYSAILVKNLQRAGELVQSFKKVAVDLSSETRQTFTVHVELDEILLSVSPLLKPTGHVIEVTGDAGSIDSYPGDFSQVVTNLVMNSVVHAYDEGETGHLRFAIARENETVSILYSDDGKGIDLDIQDRIFDPFFTTRRGAGSTGLGLHIVYNTVVQKLGGTIHCESEPDQGAQFHIELPSSSP